jgi:hypothetical protein
MVKTDERLQKKRFRQLLGLDEVTLIDRASRRVFAKWWPEQENESQVSGWLPRFLPANQKILHLPPLAPEQLMDRCKLRHLLDSFDVAALDIPSVSQSLKAVLPDSPTAAFLARYLAQTQEQRQTLRIGNPLNGKALRGGLAQLPQLRD